MDRRSLVLALAATVVVGCTPGTTCPSGYVLSISSGRCLPANADGAASDAAVDAPAAADSGVGDGAADAPADSSACAGAEVCDGADNDCDGLVDEDLATVAPAVGTGSGLDAGGRGNYAPSIGAWSSGFGLLYRSFGLGAGHLFWTPLSTAGLGGAPHQIGSVYATSMRFAADGDTIVVGADAFYPGVGAIASSEAFYMLSFRGADGSWVSPSTGMPYQFSAPNAASRVALVEASGGRATVYGSYGTSSPFTVHRYRMTDGPTPAITASSDVAPGAVRANGWDVVQAGGSEHLVAVSSAGVLLFETPSGDATTSSTMLGPLSGLPSDIATVALATRSAATPISAASPLGIALGRSAPNGIVFVQVSSPSPLTVGAPVVLPGAVGATPQSLAVVSATGPETVPHFFVVALDQSSASTTGTPTQTLRAWEVHGEPPVARAITIADDWNATRFGVSIASSNGAIRLAEPDDMGNIVTRSIGCR